MSKATSSAAGRIGAGALAAALLAGLAPAPARAQTSAPTPDRGVAIERFRMSSDRQGVLDVEWGWTEKKGSWNATLWGNYVDDPLVVRDVDSNQRLGSPIHQRVGAAASFAYSLTDRLQLGAVLPLVLWQDGQQSIAGVPALPTQSLGAIGVGNLRLVPKVGLFRSSDGRMSLAVLAHVIIPAFQKDGYFGDKNVGVEPELAGSLAVEDLRFALNAGYRWRAGTTTLVGATLHDELTARLGVGYRFGRSAATSRTPMEVDLTLAGATAANAPFDQAVQNAGALTVAFQYDLQAPVTLFGGAGMGIAPGYGVPDTQIFAGARLWSRAGPPPAAPAPVEVDPDHDGVAGALDGCPDQAEDKDGFEDDDGCPDPDNDKDGVADATDACPAEAGPPDNKGCPDKDRDGDGVVDRADTCPDQPEDKDGFEDDDGCPDLD
ncbi:MAG: hypothetical protein ABUS79_06505, partial [Pseudomonadota bacterium]